MELYNLLFSRNGPCAVVQEDGTAEQIGKSAIWCILVV